PTGRRYFLKVLATEDLLKLERSGEVCRELISRKGVRDEDRRAAVTALARLEHQAEPQLLLNAIREKDEGKAEGWEESTVFDLVRLLAERKADELVAVRSDLEKVTTAGKHAVTRQLGFVTLIAADGNTDRAWSLASKSMTALQD